MAVFLQVGPPVLCRAGVLVECCDHEPRKLSLPAATEPSLCCGDGDVGGDPQQPSTDPVQRKCGTCAGVCTTVIKPSDDSQAMNFVVLSLLPAQIVSEASLATGAMYPSSHAARTPILPYPPSDLPLLI